PSRRRATAQEAVDRPEPGRRRCIRADAQPGGQHAPGWIVVAAGLAFLCGGGGVMVQGFGRADEHGTLLPTPPRWITALQHLMAMAIVLCLAAVGSWVALFRRSRSVHHEQPALRRDPRITRCRPIMRSSTPRQNRDVLQFQRGWQWSATSTSVATP